MEDHEFEFGDNESEVANSKVNRYRYKNRTNNKRSSVQFEWSDVLKIRKPQNKCNEVDVINRDGNYRNTEMRMRNRMMLMTNISINQWQNQTTRSVHLRTEIN
ncbi:24022_t:CDS:2 [Gigaspora margarita]|uniref:24022_t:CDS:1 n=1 Tax=Gigaspora margarita TaxID=4874 RepID=A0ABM8W4S7_GIGMA|nr:24022_t:CDS:2 [Gigaspora margarita]